MVIEPAEAADYEAICDVIAENDRLHVERTPDVFCAKAGPPRTRAWLLESIEAEDRSVLVARDGGTVVGIVEVALKAPREADGFVRRRVAMIDDVVVREPCRGRGIGRALLEAAHEWAVTKGAESVQLHVWSWNSRARELYERLGYITRGLVMEVPLRGAEVRG